MFAFVFPFFNGCCYGYCCDGCDEDYGWDWGGVFWDYCVDVVVCGVVVYGVVLGVVVGFYVVGDVCAVGVAGDGGGPVLGCGVEGHGDLVPGGVVSVVEGDVFDS